MDTYAIAHCSPAEKNCIMDFCGKFTEALNVGLVEWKIYFCIAWYYSCEIMIFFQTVTRCISMRPRRVNIDNRRLVEAKLKGCQVRYWIVGERNM